MTTLMAINKGKHSSKCKCFLKDRDFHTNDFIGSLIEIGLNARKVLIN